MRISPGLIRRWPGLQDAQVQDGKAVYAQRPGRLLFAIPLFAIGAVLVGAFASGNSFGEIGAWPYLVGGVFFGFAGLLYVLQRGRVVIDPSAKTVTVDYGLHLLKGRTRTIASGEIESAYARPAVLMRKTYDLRDLFIVTLKLRNGELVEIITIQNDEPRAGEMVSRLREVLPAS